MKIQLFISLSLIPLLLTTIPCPTFASVQRTVTVDRGAQDPAVSPDGSQIAVGILGKIWLVPIGGGQARQVTYGPSWDSHPAWSLDGQFLAYAHQRPGRTELVVHNLATGGSRTIYSTERTIGQIAYAPRGGEIFFLHDSNHEYKHMTAEYRFGHGAISPGGVIASHDILHCNAWRHFLKRHRITRSAAVRNFGFCVVG